MTQKAIPDGYRFIRLTPQSEMVIGFIRGGYVETVFGRKYDAKQFPDIEYGIAVPTIEQLKHLANFIKWKRQLEDEAKANPEGIVAQLLKQIPPPVENFKQAVKS
jgi:hypothetical protein